LREERRLRVFENRVLRRILESRRDEVTGEWRNLHNGELLIQYCVDDQIDKNEISGACSTYGEREEVCTGFWWGNVREGGYLEDPGEDGRIILR
jgi:hypothetical protein